MRGYDQPAPAEYLDDPADEGACPACGGNGTPQTRPDRDGQYDPCDACEGTGLIDFERDRPHA